MPRSRARVAATWAAAVALFGGAVSAFAQGDYPSRPITLIVPFAAGGPTDVVARILSQSMSRSLGQPIVIENVIGAGGTTGGIRAMRSPPDGYTIIMGNIGTHAAAVALYSKLAYNPALDFEPIGVAARLPVLILARRGIEANNLEEFIAYAQRNEGALTMAHAGMGSVSYVSCSLFNSIAGLKPRMVAFQGTAPAMNALVAGRVDYLCDQVVSVVPQIKAASIRAFAISTGVRNPVLPDIPTAAEAGLPEFQVLAWNALFAPKNTPKPIVDKLNAALNIALDEEATRRPLLELGSEIPARVLRSPKALALMVASEIIKWTPVLASQGAPNAK